MAPEKTTFVSSKDKSITTEFNGSWDRHTYSGVDITAYISIPPAQGSPLKNSETVMGVLGTLQTISYSIHREVVPVRALGKSRAHSYTRGPRTIAGTMVWTTMDQYVLADALRGYGYSSENSVESVIDTSTILVDQLPPFDVVMTFANENPGRSKGKFLASKMCLLGIRMVNEGSTMSIDDMLVEQTNTYVATDIDLMHRDQPFKVKSESLVPYSAEEILSKETKKRISSHRNPFI